MVLRELLVKLGLDVDAQSFAKGEIAVGLLKAGLHKLQEIGHEAIERFEETLEAGDKIKKTSQSIGIATKALQELQYAGALADLSAEDMSTSIGILSRNMQHAKEGSEGAAKAFKGINIKGKTTDEVLGEIADKFKKMPDGAEQTALAMQLFGRSGKAMIPLLNEGAEGLAEMRQEANDLGLVLDDKAINASEKLNDNFKRLHQLTVGLWRQALAPLIPAINNLVKRFFEWRKENAKIIAQNIRKYVDYLIKTVEVLADTFSFLVKNTMAVKIALGFATAAVLAFQYASVGAALKSAGAWALAMLPFVAIAAAVAGIMLFLDDVRVFKSGKGRSVIGMFAETIKEWQKPNDNDPWWLKAIKALVIYMEKALGIADKLGVKAGDAKKAFVEGMPGAKATSMAPTPGIVPGRYNAENNYGISDEELKDPNSSGARYVRARNAGLGNTRASMAAADWFGQGKYVPAAAPEYRGDGQGSGVMINAPVNVQVTQQPGESGEAFADRFTDNMKNMTEHWNGQMQEASSLTGQ